MRIFGSQERIARMVRMVWIRGEIPHDGVGFGYNRFMSDNATTINCIIGTRAQLIKMAPVIRELERSRCRLNLVFTGQHQETMEDLLRDFAVETRGCYLHEGREVTGLAQMAIWFTVCFVRVIRHPERYFSFGERSTVFLVHGDTFSTLLGALLGKVLGATVAHVESGLRSFRIFHPFPEELTRLLLFRLSDVAYCPGSWAYDNMEEYRACRIDTGANTIRDALDIALGDDVRSEGTVGDYAVFSIHRFENIFFRRRLTRVIALLERVARKHPVVFVLHPATRVQLVRSGLMSRLQRNDRVTLVPRMGYIDFIALASKATFVVTDGGSNQEELSYLGVPTLLMRRATERMEGIGELATLCNYDEDIVDAFLSDITGLKRARSAVRRASPSRIIVSHLEQLAAQS